MRLSPPNASKAKLPAIKPNPTEPRASTIIHTELKYSTLMPVPILNRLQDWWTGVQQQEEQLEQSSGVWQSPQQSSVHPHAAGQGEAITPRLMEPTSES